MYCSRTALVNTTLFLTCKHVYNKALCRPCFSGPFLPSKLPKNISHLPNTHPSSTRLPPPIFQTTGAAPCRSLSACLYLEQHLTTLSHHWFPLIAYTYTYTPTQGLPVKWYNIVNYKFAAEAQFLYHRLYVVICNHLLHLDGAPKAPGIKTEQLNLFKEDNKHIYSLLPLQKW